MINLEFTKHVHRTARRLWRERFSRPEVFGPEGAYSSLRECIRIGLGRCRRILAVTC